MTKVLIIEDESLVAEMYQKALTLGGFEAHVAIGGNEGLTKVKQVRPDLVLLDIMMSEPNGMQVLEKIKADPDIKAIPVVMLTNLSGKEDAKLALEKGAAAYWIKKEAGPKELGKKIEKILEKSSGTKTEREVIGYERG